MYTRITAFITVLAMVFSLAFLGGTTSPAAADEVVHRAKVPAGCLIEQNWGRETTKTGKPTNTAFLTTEAFCTEKSGYYPIVQMHKAERCTAQILGRGPCVHWVTWPSEVKTITDVPMESDVRKIRIKDLTALSWQYGVRQTVTFYKANDPRNRTHVHPNPKNSFVGVKVFS